MNQAHLHLLVNHLPVMGTLFGILVLASGYILKSQVVKRTALFIFIFSTIGIFASNFTGEGAEDVVEVIPGISKKMIHHHEDNATIFSWCLYIVSLLSIVSLFFELKRKNTIAFLYHFIFAASFVTLLFAQRTATSGGEIRHTEIRPISNNTQIGNPEQKVNQQKDGDDEDH